VYSACLSIIGNYLRNVPAWLTRLELSICLTLMIVSSALAGSYAVELDTPSEIKPLLEQHLQIYVEIADPDLT
jgi:hypothetical protein